MPSEGEHRHIIRLYREREDLHIIAHLHTTGVAEILQILALAGEPLRPGAISRLPAAEQTTLARQIATDTARGCTDDSLTRKYGLPAYVLASLRERCGTTPPQPTHPRTTPPPHPPPHA
ncbi:hypothetical protein [Amycolatopsis sp. PS_44_ISF1]|uniref:hypothetical protein n=1 Tax=Amycolatopsis sp. PS_44_ISF1 TaxID=2974917 RepID=UPI0028DDF07F|nr:hypothetical protein [Amycolatopsis sp. PS_44_ISF1]MDT8913556.1 hypothetical protein [Amycolatopsis sp. PS_44_ISF1]